MILLVKHGMTAGAEDDQVVGTFRAAPFICPMMNFKVPRRVAELTSVVGTV